MRTRSKVGIGCLAIILALVGAGAWFWFTREPRPIVVAEAGDGGERVMLGETPANFYPGAGEGPRPAILLLGGSEGGLKDFRNAYARQLAAEGYSVLYPGYTATGEANRAFNMVPLEIFDAALDWLAARPDIASGPVAAIGHSKGAEGALLLASRDPRIGAVVAAMPSDVVWQGFSFDQIDMSDLQSSWSAGGKPVPYARYEMLPWYEWASGATMLDMFEGSRAAAEGQADALIAIEQIEAPVMLICGEQDNLWPGCDMARNLRDRAAAGGPEVELLAYEDAGHWGFGSATSLAEGDKRYLGRMGGSEEADMAAREDQWPKILAFLRASLR
ncbi:acyl-CoA thioester hydrolase/BAAT C-terminal domain-containing protein [Qipengyuania sp. G39]|uniref:Acyl-CoA thioester hydrolase/BAAT C-terminal domain-containing protein n=1 Tax=Qipengyuania profundimaris TaxID=3067652 RepID=A0ABT9HQK7_9SPHN|nr:acyl-CoA thioester hydrolase/BAAT C-terminal domain-containing protein [Qipengyuania sp. G39]MDP4575439.1 acyl-CoA thioester hydrolase/BAAT C-terminal domain-containing protein [Qipengyuania sp. G39]